MTLTTRELATSRKTPAIVDVFYLDGGVGRYANPGCSKCGLAPVGGYGSHSAKKQDTLGQDCTRLMCPRCGHSSRLSVLANYGNEGSIIDSAESVRRFGDAVKNQKAQGRDDAFREGCQAFRDGKAIDENPYASHTKDPDVGEFSEWRRGWAQMNRVFLGTSDRSPKQKTADDLDMEAETAARGGR